MEPRIPSDMFIPSHYGPSRRRIVIEFQRLRERGNNVEKTVVYQIASNLGYSIDRNFSNDFVRRVLKDYLRSISHSGVMKSREVMQGV